MSWLKSAISSVEEQFDKALDAKVSEKASSQESIDLVTKLKEEGRELSKQILAQQETIKKLTKEKKQLIKQLEGFEESNQEHNIAEELERLQTENKMLRESQKSSAAKITSLKERLEREIARSEDLQISLGQETSPLVAEVSRLQQDLATSEQTCQNVRAHHKKEVIELKQKIVFERNSRKEQQIHFKKLLSSFIEQISKISVQEWFEVDELDDKLVGIESNLRILSDALQKSQETRKNSEQIPKSELETRFEKTLLLLGEKSEKIFELEQDIIDMRRAYKEQIELLSK